MVITGDSLQCGDSLLVEETKMKKKNAAKVPKVTNAALTTTRDKAAHVTPKHSQTSRHKAGNDGKAGGETHQAPTTPEAFLSTNQGLPISDNQNSLKAAKRGPTLLKISFSAKKSRTSIMNGSLNALCMHAAWELTDIFSPTNP